jgi:hypothetical protein
MVCVSACAVCRGFALTLKGVQHDVLGYEDMHWQFMCSVEDRIEKGPVEKVSQDSLPLVFEY